MILVLIAAAAISGVLGDWQDAAAIIVIVVLNAAVGAAQEYRAERTIAQLRKIAAPLARVVRDGTEQTVAASDLVPGDVVRLVAGDIVPADLRLIETAELHADESTLTGEPLPSRKDADSLAAPDASLGDRHNMTFKQTSISKGTGSGLVVNTGAATEIGRIAALLTEHRQRTPLQQRLAIFGQRLALGVLAICAVIFVLGIADGQPPLLMFLTAVSLAVAAIPEALPAVVTITLALGARKLSQKSSLVRRLPAVESLGSVTCICTDKTGTLTQNRMTVAGVAVAGRAFADISDLGGRPLDLTLAVFALCNEIDPDNVGAGDPTEVSLLEAAHAAGMDRKTALATMPQIGLLAFDSERKLMTTLHSSNGAAIALTKGAPEKIFAQCTAAIDASGTQVPFEAGAAQAAADELAGRGYRMLAIAFREFDEPPSDRDADTLESGLTYLGLVGLHDPIRPEVPAAIRECRSAGIKVIMITGDHPVTALRVAAELGLGADDTPVTTGNELQQLSDAELLQRIHGSHVFARVDPAQKLRIVEALQESGEFVAMTGDGINDAPALKQATIGVAMGGRGTDVAREASDIILLDDNFATIVAAVREGRRIYDNIRKFIRYTLTSNSGEIWVILFASVIGLPLPLQPIQILWINLATDGLPGLAFSTEPAEDDVMRRPPRSPRESVFAGRMLQYMLIIGLLIAGLSLGTVALADPNDTAYWQTMVFTTLVMAQLCQALSVRSEHSSLLEIGLFTNRYMLAAIAVSLVAQTLIVYVPFLNDVLETTPLSIADFLICLGLGAVMLPILELQKRMFRPSSS